MQSPSIDFNQMLVVSVFFHFFFFTVLMFLPQTQDVVKHIKPAFMVSLVDIPAGPEIPPAPQVEETPRVPSPPEVAAAEKPIPQKPKPVVEKPKPVPKPKPVLEKPVPEKPKPVPKPKPAVEKPKPVPEKPAISKALVSKLDQLSQLEKAKTVPRRDKVAAKPRESALEDFENIKMKTATEKKKKPVRKKIAKDDLTLQELEFEHLSRQSATRRQGNKSKKNSSLLKELDELEQLNKQAQVALNQPAPKRTDTKSRELLRQLESIKKESVHIDIDTSKLSSRHSRKFQSEIRNLEMADIQRRATAPSTGQAADSASDALSKYVGEIYAKIFENWKDPLGGGDGRVQVSFSIFPRGNIAMPKILKSSGDPKLDNLAVRAIKNAVPLPPFPKEIKEPNLPLILKFDYVPSKR